MNQLEEDLERIIKAKNADLGLFVLAMHSLMERCLCEKYSDGVYDTENTFGILINRYTDDFYIVMENQFIRVLKNLDFQMKIGKYIKL